MKTRQILAENLKRRRKAMRLSQEELAHQAGLDRTYISALERTVYAASVDKLELLANVLKVSPARLLEEISNVEQL
ncbi:MAG: transcriptional regulator [Erythrobacter sp.]|nr:transcriptional regulator [Erythrobacter sp.]|tara:strand:- start:3684 stop:3911 length:228 start_codon:yes stop_codon:yes gene_type:complete